MADRKNESPSAGRGAVRVVRRGLLYVTKRFGERSTAVGVVLTFAAAFGYELSTKVEQILVAAVTGLIGVVIAAIPDEKLATTLSEKAVSEAKQEAKQEARQEAVQETVQEAVQVALQDVREEVKDEVRADVKEEVRQEIEEKLKEDPKDAG